MSQFKVFSGTKSRYVAEEIAHDLGVELGKMNIQHFADGEFEVSFEESAAPRFTLSNPHSLTATTLWSSCS